MPRLDIPFKKTQVREERRSIPEIRVHWYNFCSNLEYYLKSIGHSARTMEFPMWEISPKLVSEKSIDSDYIFIPHKMKQNWYLDKRILYYMQMVIPNLFSIDQNGWCATSSKWPIKANGNPNSPEVFDLIKRANNNESKFPQPKTNLEKETNLPKRFILFICQIPHDETIRFHSDIGVEMALKVALEWTNLTNSGVELVIKGHPINPSSMEVLKNMVGDFKSKISSTKADCIHWIDNKSIHTLIKKSLGVLTVNSGAGLEAIIHKKRVFTFGNADYASVAERIVYGGSINNAVNYLNLALNKIYNKNEHMLQCYKFLDSWCSSNFDSGDYNSFSKLSSLNILSK